MRIPLLIMALLACTPAGAGAWLRDQGAAFLSLGSTFSQSGNQTGSIYGEYGLRPKLTLGIKVDVGMAAGQVQNGRGFIFARKPIPTGERAYKLAYELGIGGAVGSDAKGLARVGLSYGRGIRLAGKSGWLAIDSAVEWVEDDTVTAKLDSTLGLTLNDRFQVMVQVFYTHTDSAQTTTLAPSVIWRPKSDARNSYQLGVEAADGDVAIKLGLWRSF